LRRPLRIIEFTLAFQILGLSALHTEERWPDERTLFPFVLHADFSLDGQRGLIDQMARLQQDLSSTLGVQSSQESIHLFLFQRRNTYQNYIKEHFTNLPYRRALYIKERGPGMVFAYRHDDFETDVRHESTHALLHGALPMVPLWLDEGLAEYFEVPPQKRVYGNEHLGKLKWHARFGKLPKIERLEQIDSISRMGQTEYREAWAWVHFMIHGPQAAREELRDYLADIQAHSPPGILSKRLRRRILDLDSQLSIHLRTWKK
jgi:hypothetical protein